MYGLYVCFMYMIFLTCLRVKNAKECVYADSIEYIMLLCMYVYETLLYKMYTVCILSQTMYRD